MHNFYPTKLILPTLALGFSLTMGTSLYAACVPNDCASLGYTKSASECAGMETIKCPFDDSKLYCPDALFVPLCVGENVMFCEKKSKCTNTCNPNDYTQVKPYTDTQDNLSATYFCKDVDMPSGSMIPLEKKRIFVMDECIDECEEQIHYNCRYELVDDNVNTNNNTTFTTSDGWKSHISGGGGGGSNTLGCGRIKNCATYCQCRKYGAQHGFEISKDEFTGLGCTCGDPFANIN